MVRRFAELASSRISLRLDDKCNLTAAMVVVNAEEYGCARRYSKLERHR